MKTNASEKERERKGARAKEGERWKRHEGGRERRKSLERAKRRKEDGAKPLVLLHQHVLFQNIYIYITPPSYATPVLSDTPKMVNLGLKANLREKILIFAGGAFRFSEGAPLRFAFLKARFSDSLSEGARLRFALLEAHLSDSQF